jgi:SOS-response transcriptional repressor LexA
MTVLYQQRLNGECPRINENASLKEFQKTEGGKSIKLIPHNDAMKAQSYNADRVQIQGVLVSVVRTYHR